MNRRTPRAALGVVALLLVAVGAGLAPAASASPAAVPNEPRRVLVVTLPRVTWQDVRDLRPPTLSRFLGAGAVASMSTRTVGPRTDGADAYVTMGAGNRADVLSPATAGDAENVTESTTSGTAADVYRRRTGIRPTGDVVVLSIAEQIARNEALLYGSEPGALAGALGRQHRVAAVGNADTSLDATDLHREIALAGMRPNGQVSVGNVASTLLVADPLAPFGVRTDADALVTSVEEAWTRADVQFVEMSDLERAEEARAESTVEQGDAQFDAALQRSDAVFARLLATVDPARDLVMVVAPTAPVAGEQLTVFGMQGPGVDAGWARSPTTRRDGFVTLTDIAPTILDRYGIDAPDSMNDTPIASVSSSEPLSARIDEMVRADERAVFRDDATGPITVAFIVALVVLLLAVMWCLARAPGWRRPLGWCCLVVMAVPAVMFASGLLPYDPFSVATFCLAVLAGAIVLAALAGLARRIDPVAPPVVVAAVAVLVLGADIVTGGHLQLNTMFGYSPIVAGRFAGYGNQAFSIITISALVLVTGAWEIWRRLRPSSGDAGRLLMAIAVFGAVVVLDGAPFWGADVGGVLASIPAFTVCILLLMGRRIRPRLVAVIAAVTVGVLVLFAAIDLARPVDSRTHLGRFAQKMIDGDGAVILQRKLEANMSILTSTVWTFVIPVALLFLAYLSWRPNRTLRRLNAEHDGFRAFGISGLTLGIVAWAVNDSGVAIPALMLTVALPYTAYLVLDLVRRGDVDGADGSDSAGGVDSAVPA